MIERHQPSCLVLWFDWVTGDVHQLLSSQDPLAGKRPKFLNDIEEGENGTIYFTDSSTRWDRRHNRYCILEGETSGRYEGLPQPLYPSAMTIVS